MAVVDVPAGPAHEGILVTAGLADPEPPGVVPSREKRIVVPDHGRFAERGHGRAPRRTVIALCAGVPVGEHVGALVEEGGVALPFPSRRKERGMEGDPLLERHRLAGGHDRPSGKAHDRIQAVPVGFAHELRAGEPRLEFPAPGESANRADHPVGPAARHEEIRRSRMRLRAMTTFWISVAPSSHCAMRAQARWRVMG